MSGPDGFSWIERPRLAAMAQPYGLEDYHWLRGQGIQLVICLTEDPPRRAWLNEAGLFSMHVPIEDMQAPAQSQIDMILAAIAKANANDLGVVIHCTAGLGRTGTLLACWFVQQGMSARDAIGKVRRLRTGSIETIEQEAVVIEFARRLKTQAESDLP